MEITNFLFAAAGFVLLMVAIGLVRVLRGPDNVDRILSAQLVGSGGVAILLLLAVAMKASPVMDVALMLALLATFVSVGFLRDASDSQNEPANTTDNG